MKARWVVLLAVLGFALAITLGSALAAGRQPSIRPQQGTETTDAWVWMDRMHGSPLMQQMREQMGPELAAQCDALHAQMREQMQQQMGSGMMTGSGMMGSDTGSGMMGSSGGSGMMG